MFSFWSALPRVLAALVRWWRRLTWKRRAVWVSGCVALWMFLTTTAPVIASDDGGAPSSLSWMKLQDDHGLSVWDYGMSIKSGHGLDVIKSLCAFYVVVAWEVYRALVVVALWLFDFVIGFVWLDWVAEPLGTLTSGLTRSVNDLGVVPLFLLIAGVVGGVLFMSGKMAIGIYEWGMTLVIAGVISGILSNPVGGLTERDGAIIESRDFGLGVAARMDSARQATDDGPSGLPDPETTRVGIQRQMISTFIRTPQQILNYGRIVERGDCARAYSESLEASENGYEKLGDCSEEAKNRAENPGPAMVIDSWILMVAGIFVMMLFALCAAAVLMSVLWALYAAVMLVFLWVVALLPGRARAPLAGAFAEIALALLAIAGSVVFSMGFMMFVRATFVTTGTTGQVMRAFIFTNIILLAGCVMLFRFIKNRRKTKDKFADGLLKRPGKPAQASRHASPTTAKLRAGAAGTMTAARGTGAMARRAKLGTKARAVGEFAVMATPYGVGRLGKAGLGAVQRRRRRNQAAEEPEKNDSTDKQQKQDPKDTTPADSPHPRATLPRPKPDPTPPEPVTPTAEQMRTKEASQTRPRPGTPSPTDGPGPRRRTPVDPGTPPAPRQRPLADSLAAQRQDRVKQRLNKPSGVAGPRPRS